MKNLAHSASFHSKEKIAPPNAGIKHFGFRTGLWAAIEPLLPKNQPGARRVDDRRVISGIIHVLRIGSRWEDCPPAYGPPTMIYNRFNRWSHRGLWGRISATLAAQAELPDDLSIDSTAVRAHRLAHGGKGGEN